MTEETKPNGNNGAGPPAPTPAELAAERERFLAAVERARKAAASRSAAGGERPGPALQLVGSPARRWQLAAALLLFSAGLVLLLLLQPTTNVVALQLSGVSGVVTNSVTNRVQQGVVFRRSGDKGGGTIACISDAMGAFSLPAPPDSSGQSYDYSFGGKAVGSLVVGPSRPQVCGVANLEVRIPAEALHLAAEVSLQPGEQARNLLPNITLSLDKSAQAPWSGRLRYDTDWPACFCYARVLDGLVQVDGPPAAGLRLSLAIDPEKLSALDGASGDIELVSHDASYAEYGNLLYGDSGLFPSDTNASFHHGWYVTDAPYGALPKGPALRLTRSAEGEACEWQPAPGKPYALLLRQRDQGQPTAAWLGQPISGTADFSYTAIVGLLGGRAIDNSLYLLRYRFPDGTERDFGSYPDIYNSYKMFGGGPGIDAERARDPLFWAFPRTDEHLMVPGKYLLYLMDFTLGQPYEYEPITGDFTVPPQKLSLQVVNNGIGKAAHCRVLGPLPKLADRIEWDLHQDGVVDGFGTDYEFLVPCPGSYIVTATVRRQNGIPILLRRSLNVAPPCVIGYLPLAALDQPVVRAAESVPHNETKIRYLSITNSSRPAELAWLTSPYAGPSIYFDLPEDFRRAPLKELRVYLSASPRGGDNATFGITPQLECVKGLNAGLEYPFDYSGEMMPENYELGNFGPDSWIGHAVSRAFEARGARAAHAKNPVSGARDYFLNLIAPSPSRFINETTETILGLDPRHPPSEEETIRRVEAFLNSPRCCWLVATQEEQPLACTAALFGTQPSPGARGMIFTLVAQTENVIKAAQLDLYSGPQHPSRIELETTDGRVLTRYFDYSGYQAGASD